MKLDGRVALITGAASGIGYAIAKRFLEAGGRVAIADLSADGARRAAGSLADAKSAIAVGMDVAIEDQTCSLPLTSARPVDLVVTEMAVIGFAGGRATLLETAPGVSVAEVVRATEANLAMAEKVGEMML